MVLKYQIHSCQPGCCFKKDAKYTLFKYGFPYALLKEDGVDESGISYSNARFESEDAKVVPYNRELLKAWEGHINVQRVTQFGFLRIWLSMLQKLSLHLH